MCCQPWPKAQSALNGAKAMAVVRGTADIYLINPEGIPWLQLQRGTLGKIGFDLLVLDELTKFKNWNAKRSRALRKMLPGFKYRLGLTGTPSPNTVLDLHSQAYMMDDGDTLGKTKTIFCARYMTKGGYRGRAWVPSDGAGESVQKAISPMALRLDANDYLDMPDLLINDIDVEMPPKLVKVYKKFELELFAELASGEDLTATNAGAKYALCRQLANGAAYQPVDPAEPQRRVSLFHDAKLDALQDLVDELQGKPLLVGYQFKHDVARLSTLFPNAPVIAGGVSAEDTDRIVGEWNAGDHPVLFAQPQAMGHGLNLQKCANDVAWFGLTDNLETYLQFNARVYRQGVSGSQVRIHRFLTRGTVDMAIRDRIDSKNDRQATLLDSLNEYRDKAA